MVFFVQVGPQSTEAAAELAPPATSSAPHALDPGSPRSQGSFNIFNLSPQDFSLSPLHRGHNDSQQVGRGVPCNCKIQVTGAGANPMVNPPGSLLLYSNLMGLPARIVLVDAYLSSWGWRSLLRSMLSSSAMLQGSPTGGHLGALSPFAVSELRFTPTPPPVPEGEGHAPANRDE